MSEITQLTTHDLWVDGRQITISIQFLTSTTLRVSWTLPATYEAYDGAIVLLSEEKFGNENYPEDGRRYTPSSNFTSPADTIGNAPVVAAFYGYFGDDVQTLSVDVSNVDDTKIYYASIHAASNVLQYYTIGSQSYPLDSSRFDRQSETYAGSIPSSITPPSDPTNGQAYFDPSTNKVLIWNDTTSAWLETDPSTVPTGERPAILPNQIFFDTGAVALKFFISGAWVTCNSTNTRIKFGSGTVPLATVSMTMSDTPTAGDVSYYIPPLTVGSPVIPQIRVYTLGQWLPLAENLMQFETAPSTWTNVVFGALNTGPTTPAVPTIGDFFYKTSSRDLLVWDGEQWVKSDTDSEGTPTSEKVGIGSDGSYTERLSLIKVLKGQLGWPQVCVELTEEQFNIAIDNALDEFRRRADNAYTHRHILFTLKSGQSNYYLNDPRMKTDKIVNIMKIHRVSQLGINSLGGTENIFAQPFVQQFYNGTQVDLVSIHLMANLAETFEKIFAGNITYTWDEASRQMTIYREVSNAQERVVLEVVMERTEQELLADRWAKQWLQGWAHAELKEMLGMIRSKYSSVAGPNGGLSLNGDLLISEARSDFEDLLRQILDYEVGNGGVNFGNTSFFIG